MPTLVPGGAIERFIQEHGLTPMGDETGLLDGKSAACLTEAGMVVWMQEEDGEAKLRPFGEPEAG